MAVRQLLGEGIQHQWERIFALLTLRYPQPGLVNAYFGVQSNDASVRDNSLEFLDNILEQQLRRKLLPLLDARNNATARTRLSEEITGERLCELEPAVAFLLTSRDPWLKRSGIGAAVVCELHCLNHLMEPCAADANVMVREAAVQARRTLRTGRPTGADNA
jgi:hypothetical protein